MSLMKTYICCVNLTSSNYPKRSFGMSNLTVEPIIYDNLDDGISGTSSPNLLSLPFDILKSEILDDFSADTLVSLLNTSHALSNYIHLLMCKRIDAALHGVFGPHTNAFREFMENTGSAISGSWIVQIINKTCYDSDIDIIIPISLSNNENKDRLKKFLKILGCPLMPSADPYGDHMLIHEIFETYYCNSEGKNILFNFITTKIPLESHIENYDLSIVRNSYTISPDGQSKLKTYNMEGILLKVIRVVNPSRNYLQRILKYVCRGFKIQESSRTSDIKILQGILPFERPFRGQITATVPELIGVSYNDVISSATDYHECSEKMRCPLKYFVRKYKHKHQIRDIAPSDIDKYDVISKDPYIYCNDIVIELGTDI